MFEGLLFQSTTNAINIIKSKVLVNYKAFFIIVISIISSSQRKITIFHHDTGRGQITQILYIAKSIAILTLSI